MVLDFEQIKSIANGVHEVRFCDGYYEFHRFTDKERAAMARDLYRIRSYSTSGVILRLTTDSEYVKVKYHASNKTDEYTDMFDVYENGGLIQSITTCENDKSGVFEVKLSNGIKLVEIYLPWLEQIRISEIELTDGAYVKGEHYAERVTMIGDSITQGFLNNHPSMTYTSVFGRLAKAEVINKGIGSQRFRGEQFDDTESCKGQFITVAYGTNDWNSCTYEMFKTDAGEFFEKLKSNYPDIKVYVITPIWRSDCNSERKIGIPFSQMHDEITNLCADNPNITVINGQNLIPHIPEYFADGLHPSELISVNYGMNLYREIRKTEEI